MGSTMRGGCLCGKVRYDITAEPSVVAVCHCTHCQKQSGSAFSLVVAVPRTELHVSGTLATFHDEGDSGKPALRRFCPDCGSPIVFDAACTPDLAWVKAGTLDDKSDLQPTMQIFCDSAEPWVRLDGLESYARMPNL